MAGQQKQGGGRGQGSNISCIFWLVLFVIIILAFAFSMGRIRQTLSNANIKLPLVKTDSPKPKAPNQTGAETSSLPPQTEGQATGGLEAGKEGLPAPREQDKEKFPDQTRAGSKEQLPARDAKTANTSVGSRPSPNSEKSQALASEQSGQQSPSQAKQNEVAGHRIPVTLYFMRIDNEGQVLRVPVKRSIPWSDSPLADSLRLLLRGPTTDELGEALVSLIPEGESLLSAEIQGSTAFLNFNEAFMYNNKGIEGSAAQLRQIIYTATSFPSVQDVQILINGKIRDYLGPEGVFIGKALDRNSKL